MVKDSYMDIVVVILSILFSGSMPISNSNKPCTDSVDLGLLSDFLS